MLKTGEAKTQKEAAELIGVSQRQGQRNRSLYQKKGIKGLLKPLNKGRGQTKLEDSDFKRMILNL